MATYINNTDDLECCPFDPSHRVKKSRFQLHVIKCREKFQAQTKQICPYNARHYIEESEFKHHLSICPDKGPVNTKTTAGSKETGFRGRTAVPSYFSFRAPEDENWEYANNEISAYEQGQERTVSPVSCNTKTSGDLDKYSCDRDLTDDQTAHQSLLKLKKDDHQSENPQKPTVLSKEKLLEKSLQSVRHSRGMCIGRGKGTLCGISLDGKFSVPKNSVGIGRGIITSVYDVNSSKSISGLNGNMDISEKIKELINYLPPCEPGEIRDIPTGKLK